MARSFRAIWRDVESPLEEHPIRHTNVLPVLGLAILLFEAAVTLTGALRPRVDEYYYDYYISQTRLCWLTPDMADHAETALRVDDLKVSALPPGSACFLLKRGWNPPERWGTWSNGRIAEIELPPWPGKTSVDLALKAFSPHNRQVVTAYVNGARLGQYFVPVGPVTKLSIPLPAGTAATTTILLKIKHPARPAVLGGNDQREIGIGLIALTWH